MPKDGTGSDESAKNLNLQTGPDGGINSLYNGSVRERDTRKFLGVD